MTPSPARLLLLAAVLLLPAAGDPNGTKDDAPNFAPSPAWETVVDQSPARPPIEVPVGNDRSAMLLAGPDGIEARDLEGGAQIWSRADIGAHGLQTAPLLFADGRAVAGWTGQDADGKPVLRVIDLGSGKDLLVQALPEPALAPPLPRPTSAGLPRWSVLLDDQTIVTFDRDGRRLAGQTLAGPVYPRLWSLLSHPTALSRDGHRLLLPFLAAQRLRPRDLVAETIAIDGRWLLAAGDRWFAAWRCRENRRGRIRCRRQWKQSLGGTVSVPAQVAGKTILVSCQDTFIYAFRRDNGHLLWRRATGRRLSRPAMVRGDLVITAVGDTEVQAFDLDTGQSAGTLDLPPGEHLATAPGLAGDLLLLVTHTMPESVVRLRTYALSTPQPPLEK